MARYLSGEVVLRILEHEDGKPPRELASEDYGVNSSTAGVDGIVNMLRDATATSLQSTLDQLAENATTTQGQQPLTMNVAPPVAAVLGEDEAGPITVHKSKRRRGA